jgi:hypothetical protein
MNTPPPDDMQREVPPVSESEARIAKDAERARRQVAARFPGEAGKKETDTGKSLLDLLGIGKGKK